MQKEYINSFLLLITVAFSSSLLASTHKIFIPLMIMKISSNKHFNISQSSSEDKIEREKKKNGTDTIILFTIYGSAQKMKNFRPKQYARINIITVSGPIWYDNGVIRAGKQYNRPFLEGASKRDLTSYNKIAKIV